MYVCNLQKENNFTLPKWTRKVFPKQINDLRRILAYRDVMWLKVRRLATGNFHTTSPFHS